MQALRTAARCSTIRRACGIPSSLQNSSLRTSKRHRSCTAADAVTCALYVAPAEEHLQQLAALLAEKRHAGDCYLLYGSVGAGKSVFSRAFIRAAAQDPYLSVPSPTYLLQLIYDEQQGPPIHHFDLYRLDQQQDMSRLDLQSSYNSAVNLIEWAERLHNQSLPQQRLEVHIQILNDVQSNNSAVGQQQQQTQWSELVQQQQQQVQAILQQQQQQQEDVSSLLLLLPTPFLQATAAADPDVEQDWLDEDNTKNDMLQCDSSFESDDVDCFTDQRWRLVQLKAVGDSWKERLQQLAQDLQQQQQQQQ